MTFLDYIIILIMAIVLIIGGYQFYFWTQKHVFFRKRQLLTFIDSWFSRKPAWVWVYSGIYYPIIIFSVFTIESMRHFNYVFFSYFILLAAHMSVFVFFPVEIPEHWRKNINGKTLSERFLRLIHKIDSPSNCFPSMHVSVAMLTSFHLMRNAPQLGVWAMIFPLLISLSVLYTKQHYFVDIPSGLIFGWGAFKIFELVYI